LIIDNEEIDKGVWIIDSFLSKQIYTDLLVLIIVVNIRNTSYPERVTYNNDG